MIDQYIQKYGKRLYGLCLTLCASKFDADDLYQETWMKVLRSIEQYDQAQSFEPWLTRICVNTYRNALRRIARSPIWSGFSSTEEKDALLNAIPANQPDHEPDYTELHNAVDALPEKLRLAVILFYFQDADLTATAAILKIPIGTVKSRLSKARNLLKEALSDETDLQF